MLADLTSCLGEVQAAIIPRRAAEAATATRWRRARCARGSVAPKLEAELKSSLLDSPAPALWGPVRPTDRRTRRPL
jgi:hypothetical protein